MSLVILQIWLMYSTEFCSAEIDELKKSQVAKPTVKDLKQIPWPIKVKSLQDAMVWLKTKNSILIAK